MNISSVYYTEDENGAEVALTRLKCSAYACLTVHHPLVLFADVTYRNFLVEAGGRSRSDFGRSPVSSHVVQGLLIIHRHLCSVRLVWTGHVTG